MSDWSDRFKDAGGAAIDSLLKSVFNSTGGIQYGPPSQANPTAAQVDSGQRAISPDTTIIQREGTEGLKNSLYQYFSGGNSTMTMVLMGMVLLVFGVLIYKKR